MTNFERRNLRPLMNPTILFGGFAIYFRLSVINPYLTCGSNPDDFKKFLDLVQKEIRGPNLQYETFTQCV
jgi:hypothetical protein